MNKEKNSFKDVALDFIKTLFISLIIVYILTRLIVRPISVNGNSMYPTLKDNDFGLATVFKTFINDVDRYDVVIIKLDSGEYIIKRVIGMPNDTISCIDGKVMVNGEPIDEYYLDQDYVNSFDIFTQDFDEITDISRPVIISAHGAGKDVYAQAKKLGLNLIDATCPLVAKVHRQIRRFAEDGKQIIVIGKKNHPEVVGTLGQLDNPEQAIVISSSEEAALLKNSPEKSIGVVNQTTLAVDELNNIINTLKLSFGNVSSLQKNDICYATTHRQSAIKEAAKKADAVIIIGSKNSSNSKQLQKTALAYGAKQAWLIDDAHELAWNEIDKFESLAISAGASAPDYLLDELLLSLKKRYENLNIHDIIVAEENVEFKI